MRKINLYKSLSLVLVGGGALATIPAVLTSCKKKGNGDDENLKKVDKYLNLTTNKATWGQDIASQKQGSNSIGTLKIEDIEMFGYCTASKPTVNVDMKEILIVGADLSVAGLDTNQINVILSPGCATPVTAGGVPYSLEFEASIVSISQAKILENLFIDIELVVAA